MKINAKTPVMAVIGDPIEHSLSPFMQNWFIEQSGINAVYTAFHVLPEQVKDAVKGMRSLGITGFNVTVPHKAAVVSLADSRAPEVDLLGVSNTLHNNQGHITAYVTDPVGFTESLGPNKDRFNDARVLMFGAGGAATSVAYALAQLNIKQLYISELDLDRAQTLRDMCTKKFNLANTNLFDQSSHDLNEIIANADVIINATAVGMHPHTERSVITDFSAISKQHYIYDLIYNPGMTHLMQNAQNKGATVQNGLGMLIHQGLASFRIFTGEPFYLTPEQEVTLQSMMNKALGI